MTKKHLGIFAIVMVVVFLTITVAYPLIFKPGPDTLAPKGDAPIDQPVLPAN